MEVEHSFVDLGIAYHGGGRALGPLLHRSDGSLRMVALAGRIHARRVPPGYTTGPLLARWGVERVVLTSAVGSFIKICRLAFLHVTDQELSEETH